MKTRHEGIDTARPIPYRTFYSQEEKQHFTQDHMRTHPSYVFQNAVNALGLRIDITPLNQKSFGKTIYLHLFGTKGEYFRREFVVFGVYETLPFEFYRLASDKLYSSDETFDVEIEKYSFSCNEGEVVLSFETKDLAA